MSEAGIAGSDAVPRGTGGRPVEVLVLGAGSRGAGYAEIVADHPDLGRVVGVAEPDPVRRHAFAERHALPPAQVFERWQDALAQPRLADVAVIATQDADHVQPAVASAALGYHILLEKPIAPTEAGTRTVVEAVKRAGVIVAVCHVLRYTPHTRTLTRLLADDAIGEIVSVEHLEPVGWWHMAHSFVRGSWRREDESSPMLLAKSCHDIDWLLHVVGRRCERVASFGSLSHFRRAHQPPGAADRCLDCPPAVEQGCAYSAPRIYRTALERNGGGWPVAVLTTEPTEAGVLAALTHGPYGRCVYACDNDVVDHQVVQLELEGGVTASFTMTGFSTMRGRSTRIFGTHGELTTDSQVITVDDFRTGRRRVVDTAEVGDGSLATGHGGGDGGLVLAMLAAVRDGRPELVSSDADSSLASHLVVFAAERARRRGTVEPVPVA